MIKPYLTATLSELITTALEPAINFIPLAAILERSCLGRSTEI